MTRTETDSDPETCTGVERERQVNTATAAVLGIKTEFIGAFCSQFPVRG